MFNESDANASVVVGMSSGSIEAVYVSVELSFSDRSAFSRFTRHAKCFAIMLLLLLLQMAVTM